MQGCRHITTASPGTRMRPQRKWKLQQTQNKALRLAIMMRRDSLKSALKAGAFTPFCLSTFSAICSLVLAERVLPSTLRANITAEPDNKKHTPLNVHTIIFCMHTAVAFQEGCCCCSCCCWRAVARLHFRQRPRQGRHDRC